MGPITATPSGSCPAEHSANCPENRDPVMQSEAAENDRSCRRVYIAL